MRLRRLLLAALVAGALVSASLVGKDRETAGQKMTVAAEKWLALLEPEQKGKAVFAFDDRERTNWFFTPQQDKDKNPTRKGLRLEKMSTEQKEAAKALVAAGTSRQGFTKAIGIMGLESILRDLEAAKGNAIVRNPEWYFFTIFGTPSQRDRWGWRVEGHHLSLNFTLEGSKVVAATPFFLGANPALVKAGPKKGLRTLPEAEDPARELLESLTPEQRQIALQSKQFPEIEEAKSAPHVGEPVGLAAGKMTEKQQAILVRLLQGYAERMPAEIGARQMMRVRAAGLDKVHFALAREEDKRGKPYTYRVQGPTFVIEFLNRQPDSAGNPANHIHSAWRDLPGDFGLALR